MHNNREAIRRTSNKGRLVRVAACVLLAAAVLTQTWPAVLARYDADIALWFDSGQPQARLQKASEEIRILIGPEGTDEVTGPLAQVSRSAQKLSTVQAPAAGSGAAEEPPAQASADRDKRTALAASLAELLRHDPYNPRALRILGQLAALDGDGARADELMRAAVRLSKRETVAVAWLLNRTYRNKDYAQAVSLADIILSSRSRGNEIAMPIMGALAETPEARPALISLLASKPAWRDIFFKELTKHIVDARTPLALMLALQPTPAPPTAAEKHQYLWFLNERKFFEFAYYAWLQFLPADVLNRVTFVFNGDFEAPLSGAPNDWTILNSSGATTRLGGCPDATNSRCLQARMGATRVVAPLVTQSIMVPPGRHVLRWRQRGSLDGPRGLVWQLFCQNDSLQRLAQSEMAMELRAWSQFEIEFEVPAHGCPTQELRLQLDFRSPSEQLVTGVMWYDDVTIQRQAESEAAAPQRRR